MEFHINRSIRERLELDDVLFSYTGNVVFANVAASSKPRYKSLMFARIKRTFRVLGVE